MGRAFRVSVGRGGIGEKSGEGDGVTPIGTHRVERWLRRGVIGDDAIRLNDIWVDDPAHPAYNSRLRTHIPASHERLYRPDALYNIVGVVDYNRNPVIAGKGSAIFIHQWRRPRFPTEGCVALSARDLTFVAKNWRPWSRLVVAGAKNS